MNLFMFAMLTLVLANNMLLMFVGWEGVGLCSYLLIGFYFLKKSASDAGKKAFIVNRVGDAGFILGILLTAVTLGAIRFTSQGLPDAEGASGILQALKAAVEAHALAYGAPVLTGIALLLFVGAIGKSAQIPLYVWLPDVQWNLRRFANRSDKQQERDAGQHRCAIGQCVCLHSCLQCLQDSGSAFCIRQTLRSKPNGT